MTPSNRIKPKTLREAIMRDPNLGEQIALDLRRCMRRAEARRSDKFIPRNQMFLYLTNGETIFINGDDPDNLIGLTATDENGRPLRPGRYQLGDLRLITVGQMGKIKDCIYDPMVRMIRKP